MRAISRIIWLLLCMALVCAALPGSARVRHRRASKYRAYGQYRRASSRIVVKPLVPVAFTWPAQKPSAAIAGPTTQPVSIMAVLETTPAPAALSLQATEAGKPKWRARVGDFAPLVSVVSSAIVLLAALWLVGMILRELRRVRAAGMATRGSVEMLGSAELELGTRAYFVRVEGKVLVLTTDTRHGGLAVALVPEAGEPDSAD